MSDALPLRPIPRSIRLADVSTAGHELIELQRPRLNSTERRPICSCGDRLPLALTAEQALRFWRAHAGLRP